MPLPLLYTPKTISEIFPIAGWEFTLPLSHTRAHTHDLTRAAYVFAIAWLAVPHFPNLQK